MKTYKPSYIGVGLISIIACKEAAPEISNVAESRSKDMSIDANKPVKRQQLPPIKDRIDQVIQKQLGKEYTISAEGLLRFSGGYTIHYAPFREYIFPAGNFRAGNVAYISITPATCSKMLVRTEKYEFPSNNILGELFRLADTNKDKKISVQEGQSFDHRMCRTGAKRLKQEMSGD